ncbi:hypothetical protein [Roseomonas elaeocarpi]|uniref:Uncharacterized protein n=1 Tax=Roseomonas elaeocarpi TaxID=907779 RepID=A0ABV6JMM0_9PROT
MQATCSVAGGTPAGPAAVPLRHRFAVAAFVTGLDEFEIADVIHGAAFLNWANRLTLWLGKFSVQG